MGRDLDRDSRINPRCESAGKNLLVMRRTVVSVCSPPPHPVIYVGRVCRIGDFGNDLRSSTRRFRSVNETRSTERDNAFSFGREGGTRALRLQMALRGRGEKRGPFLLSKEQPQHHQRRPRRRPRAKSTCIIRGADLVLRR